MVPTCARGLGHMLGPEPAPPRSLALCPCAGAYVKPGDKPRHFFIKNLHVENLFLVKAATWWTSGYMTQTCAKRRFLGGSTHSFTHEFTETESRRLFVRGWREGEMKDYRVAVWKDEKVLWTVVMAAQQCECREYR